MTEAARQADIDARLARFSATRHARDLWPDIPVPALRAAEAELGRVAGAVLAGAPGPIPLSRPPGGDARTLGVAATLAGMGGLMGYWCESGAVTAEPELGALFAHQLDHGRRRARHFRERFEHILAVLSERGIEVLVLKGMHTGYAYFPDPGTRIMSDLDLLVRPGDWRRARETLGDLGFEEHADPSHPEQSSWSLRAARSLLALDFTHAESAWSVDLHQSLERTAFAGLSTTLGTPDFATTELWREFARPVRVLSQPLLLAYLAVHTSSHFYGITQIRLVELALMVQRDFAGHPERWQAFDRLVASTASGRFVFPALDLVERLVPGTIDPVILAHAAAAAPRRLRRLVRRIVPASAQQIHPFPGLAERFVWIASPREALAALVWLARPRDGGAQWSRIRRAVSRIVQARLPRRRRV